MDGSWNSYMDTGQRYSWANKLNPLAFVAPVFNWEINQASILALLERFVRLLPNLQPSGHNASTTGSHRFVSREYITASVLGVQGHLLLSAPWVLIVTGGVTEATHFYVPYLP